MSRDDASGPPIWLELFVTACTLGPILYTAYLYPEFPDRIPIHWNIRGEPDGYVSRSLASAFFPAMISIFVQGLLWLLVRDLYWQLGQDSQSKAAISSARAEMFRTTLRLLQPLRVVLALMLAAVILNIPLTIQGLSHPSYFTIVMLGSAMGIVALSIWGAAAAFKAQKRFEEAASREVPEFQDRHWRLAGAFYHNPADPTLFVHKRIGWGLTLNMAHPRAKWYGVHLGATLVLVFAAVLGLR